MPVNTRVSLSTKIIITFIILFAIWIRLYHIEFGLPHSFHADEPEISELAIKYTYEAKDIIRNNNYYKLIPISYVYGTVPTYMLTIATMIFSKICNILGKPFTKTDIFIFLRIVTSLFSLIIIPATIDIYRQTNIKAKTKDAKYKEKLIALLLFLALNWKLIVHAHYVNADIFLTVFTTVSLAFLFRYVNATEYKLGNKWLILSALGFGLAIGTKITALIGLPIYWYILNKKNDFYGFLAFHAILLGTFAITNPFSILFIQDFIFRIWQMLSKEGGMVFDSVDYSHTKYIKALIYMLTMISGILAFYGMIKEIVVKRKDKDTAISGINELQYNLLKVLVWDIAIYIGFFTLQSRRVDRWLLPILPIALIFATEGLYSLKKNLIVYKQKCIYAWHFIMILTIIQMGYYNFILIQQYQRYTPKAQAYLWAKQNLPKEANKLAYTEEGLDPLNKLEGTRVIKVQVYSNENAQFFMPENPIGYDYVFIASRPMQNHRRLPVKERYPFYTGKWTKFEGMLMDTSKFELIKTFTLPKPNLIEVSDIYVYRNINTTAN